jgi:hypothetical protein
MLAKPDGSHGRPMKDLHGAWLLTATFVLGLLAPMSAHAQKTTLPAETLKPSADMSVAKRQLQMGADLGRRVIHGLETAPADVGTPLDENLIQSARNTYALIRAARESMDARKIYMKYPDPVFDLAYKRVFDAWNLARTPVDMEKNVDRPRYLATSIRDLKRALELVDQALIILP